MAGAALVLGGLAFGVDFLDPPWSALGLLLSSSGFAWGCAALVAGFAADRRGRSIGAAVAVLAIATVVYYGLIAVDGSRWEGATLEDGSSATAAGLVHVARATLFWLAASAVGGALLGWLGHTIRRGGDRAAAVAAGCALALLAGQGAVVVLRAGPVTGWWFAQALAQVVGAAAVTAALLGRRDTPRWWSFAAAGLLCGAVAVPAWSVVSGLQVG
ncbi:hypothetical protein GCM10010399_42010 [Dactylosporangium fulvum]